ncbi:MAG: hypothetical protein MZV63_60755 [Marinilabiliales bacterium]|nr:hypothetical protein [Marinilabiliales bacterium]
MPTRELALQIDQQIQGLAYTLNITSLAVYGGGEGSAWDQERKRCHTAPTSSWQHPVDSSPISTWVT